MKFLYNQSDLSSNTFTKFDQNPTHSYRDIGLNSRTDRKTDRAEEGQIIGSGVTEAIHSQRRVGKCVLWLLLVCNFFCLFSEYLGCFQDQVEDRDLPFEMDRATGFDLEFNAIYYCGSHCFFRGLDYAAMQVFTLISYHFFISYHLLLD